VPRQWASQQEKDWGVQRKHIKIVTEKDCSMPNTTDKEWKEVTGKWYAQLRIRSFFPAVVVAVGSWWWLGVGSGWWQLAVGSWWWLVVGGWWWLVVGSWRLVAVGGGWQRLTVGGVWRSPGAILKSCP
jgi:hypothetical protein